MYIYIYIYTYMYACISSWSAIVGVWATTDSRVLSASHGGPLSLRRL